MPGILRYTVKKKINNTTNRLEVRSGGLSLEVIHFLLNSLLNLLASRCSQQHCAFHVWVLVPDVNCQYMYVPRVIKCLYKLEPNSNISCIRCLYMLWRARKLCRTQEETKQTGWLRLLPQIYNSLPLTGGGSTCFSVKVFSFDIPDQ